MDYYQGVVVDYLRADRAVFVNTECCIQLNAGPGPDKGGTYWYCDAVAIDFRNHEIFLCETSYAEKLGALIERLRKWSASWEGVCTALVRDCKVPENWPIRPWLFVPQRSVESLAECLQQLKSADGSAIFRPRITSLESVQPWKFHDWNHQDKDTDKSEVPESMRS